MVKFLAVPAEAHPTQESFLLEVLSVNRPGLETTFVSASGVEPLFETHWNAAALRTFPERSQHRWVRALRTYVLDPRYLGEIWRAIREVDPDVVLVRDLTLPLLVAYLLQPFRGFRLIYQRTYPHEYRWFDPRIAERHRLPQLWLWLRRLENRVLHSLMRRCDAILTISDAMSEQLILDEDMPRAILHTFGMGVNSAQMEAHEWRPERAVHDGVLRIAYSGTLGISRDLETLLDAFAHAAHQWKSSELRLEMYGGSVEDVTRLGLHASDLGVADKVHFTGALPREEMLTHLGRCDIALNYIPAGPRYWVSCPTKQIEYLALGIPTVATDTVEIVISLASTHGGIVLARPDAESFGMGILQACEALNRYRAEAQHARFVIRDEFSYDAMASRLMELSR